MPRAIVGMAADKLRGGQNRAGRIAWKQAWRVPTGVTALAIFVSRRFLQAVPTLLGLTVVSFLLVHIVPGGIYLHFGSNWIILCRLRLL